MGLLGLEVNKRHSNSPLDIKALSEEKKKRLITSTDVVDTLASLSNDEVMTPSKMADTMLDELPSEIWSNPNLTFLDPGVKSGIFLRNIASRLFDGLADTFPDSQERRDHILGKQLFGIAPTALTAYMSRRTLYNTMEANSEYSLAKCFTNSKGNIAYWNLKPVLQDKGQVHAYVADDDEKEELHNYAFSSYKPYYNELTKRYELKEALKDLLIKEFGTMKFDVVIGNPPYQLGDASDSASASPLYHFFVENAIALQPDYICMITPSRWLTGGKALDGFRTRMLADRHIVKLVDYPNSKECFPDNEISGGVSYFLWDKSHEYDTHQTMVKTISGKTIVEAKRDLNENDIFVRSNHAISILQKVQAITKAKGESKAVSTMVSSLRPFSLRTNYDHFTEEKQREDDVFLYAKNRKGYTPLSVIASKRESIAKHKVLMGRAYGAGMEKTEDLTVMSTPFYAGPGTACTETYLVCGEFDSKAEADNYAIYMKTKFFRFMLWLRKRTQDISKEKFAFIPVLNFKKAWSDEELYKEFSLTSDEIAYIEKTIRKMD